MKRVEERKDPKEPSAIPGEVTEISPHSKAVYEAGKTMLVDSISTGREFCKTMIATSTGAIPIYLGILAFILPEDYALGIAAGVTVALPAIMYLLASIIFTIGYLPVVTQFSLDIVEQIEEERDKVINHRRKLINIGFTIFTLGTLLAIIVNVVNIGVR
jgi:hypothetical protein